MPWASFGFSFLDQNSDKVKGANVDGAEITFENIADGSYPVSRPLYFYVKNRSRGQNTRNCRIYCGIYR